MKPLLAFAMPAALAALWAGPALADTLISTDESVLQNSLCVGDGCGGDETFGTEETLRLKGAALLMEFVDTSDGPDEPANDWALTANDPLAGGLDLFAITDRTGNTRPFVVEAGAPETAMWISGSGNVGLGTGLPARKLEVSSGTIDGIRLSHTGTNEIVDLLIGTNGSFGVFDPSTGTAALVVKDDNTESDLLTVSGNRVGVGAPIPDARLHVYSDEGTSGLLIEEGGVQAARGLMHLKNNGFVYFTLEDATLPDVDNAGRAWNFQNQNGEFRITTKPGGPSDIEMRLTPQGDMYVKGSYFAGGTELNVPDYVFAPEYELRPLHEVAAFIDKNSHLPDIPSAADIAANGINMSEMQMNLLRKIEELTLYSIQQEQRYEALLADQQRRYDELSARLDAMAPAAE